jgi:hypothetical protein
MRVLRCCFGLEVLRFWILEGTLSVWSFPRVRCFELILLGILVLSVVSWLVLRVSCGSGIGSWVTWALTIFLAWVNSILSEDCHGWSLKRSWFVRRVGMPR